MFCFFILGSYGISNCLSPDSALATKRNAVNVLYFMTQKIMDMTEYARNPCNSNEKPVLNHFTYVRMPLYNTHV